MKPGDKVVVIGGLARGKTGVLRDRAVLKWDNAPMWAVEFPLPLGVRVIRADFLKLEAA